MNANPLREARERVSILLAIECGSPIRTAAEKKIYRSAQRTHCGAEAEIGIDPDQRVA